MIDFNTWIDNYIDVLNIMYGEILTISYNRNINIHNNQETFDDFCKMIYSSSKNLYLRNPEDYEFI
jgi:hypothetical protein|tara:strand:+ start:5397 stop:5594 length:198 start_codon:yes stop_codon:yes gene_type:complete